MKEVRIRLSDETVRALEARVSAGEAASLSELIEATLDLGADPGMPTREEMLADIAEVDRDLAAGARLYTADEIRRSFRDDTDN